MSGEDYTVKPLSEEEKALVGWTTEAKKPDLSTVNNGLTKSETEAFQNASKDTSSLSFDIRAAVQAKRIQDADFQASMYAALRPALDYWQAKMQLNSQEFADNLVWMEAYRGTISDESAMMMTSEDRYKELKANKIDPIENAPLSLGNIGTQIIGETLGALSFQKEIVQQSVVNGLAFGAAGGAIGLAGGPAAPASVPVMAGEGFSLGLTGTTFMMTSQLSSAQMYGELRKKGIPQEAARNYAIVNGTINGALQTAELGAVKEVTLKGFTKALTKAKPKIYQLLAETTASIGTVVTQQELTELTNIITETVAAIQFAKENPVAKFQQDYGKLAQDIKGGDIHKIAASINQVGSFGGVRERIVNSLTRALFGAAGLVVGGKVAGHTAGTMANKGLDLIKAAKHTRDIINEKEDLKLVGKVTEESTPAEKEARAAHEAEVAQAEEYLKGSVEEQIQKEEEDNTTSSAEDTRTTPEKIQDKKDQIKQLQGELNKLDTEDKEGLKKVRGQLRKAVAQRKRLQFKLFTEEANRIIDAAHSKFVVKKKETDLQRVKRFQTLMKGLVEKSELEPDQKSLFISAIINTVTDSRLEKSDIINRIAEKVEEREKQKAVSELRELLKTTKPKKGQSAFERKVGDVRQKVMDKLRHYVGETYKENEERIADLYNAQLVRDEQTAMNHQLDVDIAGLVENLRDMTAEQTRKLMESIQDSIDIGKEGRLGEIEARAEFHERITKEAIDHAQGDKPAESRSWKPVTFKDFQKRMNSLGMSVFSLQGKIKDIIFQHTVELISKELNKVLDVRESIRTADANRRKYTKQFLKTLEKHTGLKPPDLLKKIVSAMSKKETVAYTEKLPDGTFKETTIEMTRWELIQLYMQTGGESLKGDLPLRDGLEQGNGYTFRARGQDYTTPGLEKHHTSLQEALEDHLYFHDKNMAYGIQQFYQEYGKERVSKEYKERTGLDLKLEENYSGKADRESNVFINDNTDLVDNTQPRVSFKTGAQKRTIERTDNTYALKPKNAFFNVLEAINETEHKLAWREKAEDLNAIITNPEFRRIVEKKYGQRLLNSIDAHMKDLIFGERDRQKAWLDVVENIAGKSARVFLEWKPISFVKQLTAVINLAHKIPALNLVTGMFDYFGHMKEANETFKNSDYWKSRYDNFDKVFYGALNKGDKEALKRVAEMAKELDHDPSLIEKMKYSLHGMMFLQGGDKLVALAGGWAVYKHALEQGLAHEEALVKWEEAVDQTQSTGIRDELSDVARGPLKVLAMFLQQPSRMFEHELTAWRQFVNGKNTFGNAVRASAINRIATMAFVAVDAAYFWAVSGDEDKKQNAIWRIFEQGIIGPQFAVANDILNTVAAFAHNKIADDQTVKDIFAEHDLVPSKVNDKGDVIQSVPGSIAVNTKRFAVNSSKLIQDFGDDRADVIQLLQVIADYGKSANVFVGQYPIEPPAKFLKELAENENFFADNDWLAEQRALHEVKK